MGNRHNSNNKTEIVIKRMRIKVRRTTKDMNKKNKNEYENENENENKNKNKNRNIENSTHTSFLSGKNSIICLSTLGEITLLPFIKTDEMVSIPTLDCFRIIAEKTNKKKTCYFVHIKYVFNNN